MSKVNIDKSKLETVFLDQNKPDEKTASPSARVTKLGSITVYEFLVDVGGDKAKRTNVSVVANSMEEAIAKTEAFMRQFGKLTPDQFKSFYTANAGKVFQTRIQTKGETQEVTQLEMDPVTSSLVDFFGKDGHPGKPVIIFDKEMQNSICAFAPEFVINRGAPIMTHVRIEEAKDQPQLHARVEEVPDGS